MAPLKFNPVEGTTIIVKGRIVPPGTFYDAPDGDQEPQTMGELQFVRRPFISPPEGLIGEEGKGIQNIPAYDDITVSQMKVEFDAMGVDYSAHTKDKAAMYAFYVEVKKASGNNAE